ncbi:MAG: nucleotidyltransferase domain-containing protein [Fretibacterium sp.]|nr:nucleotidyltransferase domain-containing protein [Fretibacterium sp.]
MKQASEVGFTDELREELSAITREILNLLPGAQVILFGSYARGEQRKWSDLDICVVAEEFPMRILDMMDAISHVIYDKTRLPIDLLLFHRERFAYRSTKKPTIEYVIAKEGVMLSA